MKKLEKSSAFIIGIGGVGGYVCEMLARSGVGELTIMDYDVVDSTNINRQIIALTSTVGQPKVEIMKNRIKEINPECKVVVYNEKISAENLSLLKKKKHDIIIDCIDNVTDKVNLIVYGEKNNLPVISAMGAGNRSGIPNYEITDIYKTCNDGLAKVVRKLLREQGIKSHLVVSTKDKSQKIEERTIGSVVYHPAMCACVLTAYVIGYLTKE